MHLATPADVLKGFFPVSTKTYWYFSAYTGLFFLRPFLNIVVDTISKTDIKKYAFVLFVVFSTGGGIIGRNADSFALRNGYSVLWIVLLYLLGASLKKIEFEQKAPTARLVLVAVVSYAITLFSVSVLPIVVKEILHINIPRGILWSYLSPTILLMAICTLLLFAKLKVSNEKRGRWISKLAVGAFGVYLIHSNPVFDRIVLENRFASVGNQPVWIMLPAVVAIALVVFAFCLTVEEGRIMLFKKLKIEQMTKRLVQFIRRERD